MCGRFNQRATATEIKNFFDLLRLPDWDWTPRYNIAPTQLHPIIRQIDGTREATIARWGLIPSWAKDEKIGYRMINARSETVAEKPSFRAAFKRRRCLIPASGFYEWQRIDAKTKQPHHIHHSDDGLIAFAGLWERWDKGDDTVESFSIITTSANSLMATIHDRMPVILPTDVHSVWLDPDVAPDALTELMRPYDGELNADPVSSYVGNVRNEGPQCILTD